MFTVSPLSNGTIRHNTYLELQICTLSFHSHRWSLSSSTLDDRAAETVSELFLVSSLTLNFHISFGKCKSECCQTLSGRVSGLFRVFVMFLSRFCLTSPPKSDVFLGDDATGNALGLIEALSTSGYWYHYYLIHSCWNIGFRFWTPFV
jgi:hypothetical protein